MAFFKQATILPTYLFLKPAQGGLPQLSCFIVFFSVGLMQRDNIYQHLSCGWTISTRGCTLARCLHVRMTSACARSHPRKLPKRGKLCTTLHLYLFIPWFLNTVPADTVKKFCYLYYWVHLFYRTAPGNCNEWRKDIKYLNLIHMRARMQ